jgi:hypothetical protein
MARPRKTTDRPATGKPRIEQYDHKGQQRKNNPPVGLVTEATEAYRGTVSLPFGPGAHKRVAVKIVDDRGIESLKIIPVL